MKSPGAKDEAGGPPARGSDGAPARPGAEPAAQDAAARHVRALEEERDRLKAELADVRDKFLRARADYENFVKRAAKEAADSLQAAQGSLLLRFAAAAEVLERALAESQRGSPEVQRGLRLVADEIRKLLRDEGLKEIEAVGQTFNYKYHQAVARVELAEKPEGTIVEVVQRGYLLHGELLRPALVRVSVAPKKPVKGDEPKAAKGEEAVGST